MTGMDAEERQAWVVLGGLLDVGSKRCQLLVERFGSAREALAADRKMWIEVVGEKVAQGATVGPESWERAAGQLRAIEKFGGRLLTLADEEYPVLLREIAQPPPVLFALGEPVLDLPGVAIVGPRKASRYGLDVAGRLARGLAEAGLCVVSGMAAGIDTAAHRGALEGGGRTVAVLGCGVDVVYPAPNAELHRRIRKQGAVISEFPMGAQPDRGSFPRRNRIISGLSLGVVVVEAPERSGSLITMRYAAEQGRDLFAVPGSVLEGRNTGCHRLIIDGATLVEKAEDILEELHHWEIGKERVERPVAQPEPPLSEAQQRIFSLLDREPCHVDQLAEQAEMGTADLLGVLLELELDGRVAQLPGKQFARAG
jgi:DNA processing protein